MPMTKQKLIKKKEGERNVFTKNEIIIHDEYLEVITYNINCKENGRFIVDLDMLDFIKTHKCGMASTGYIKFGSKNFLHRFIMKAKKGEKVDHINRITTDNRKCNLRICTHLENSRNSEKRKKNTTSKYKGVYYLPKVNGWSCGVSVGNKQIRFGTYPTELEAAYIYNLNVKKYFGEFSVYNNIDEKDINELKKIDIKTLFEKRKIHSQYPHVTYNVCKKRWIWEKTIKGKHYGKQGYRTEEDAHIGFLEFMEEINK